MVVPACRLIATGAGSDQRGGAMTTTTKGVLFTGAGGLSVFVVGVEADDIEDDDFAV